MRSSPIVSGLGRGAALRTRLRMKRPVAALALTTTLLAAAPPLAADTVEQWLQRMSSAVEKYNYRGTVARRFEKRTEYMQVVHRYADGQISERIETLDGADRTLIRDKNGIRCVLPDSKAVLYQDSSAVSGFVGRMPMSIDRLLGHYDVVFVRSGERVADRTTVQLAIRPRDEWRYGHRIWLERPSGLTLKSELLDVFGRVIEETRFVNLSIEETIPDNEFEFDINVSGFRQIGYTSNQPAADVTVDSTRFAAELPAGFVMTHRSQSDDGVIHLKFDDGMASVSAFVEPIAVERKVMAGASRLGGTHTYSLSANGRQVTAVGEVPLETVRRVAESIAKLDFAAAQ
ncbi:MAG: MucB/RseB C-terminal domain-containing protein [Pseudomonadota bacterium]